MIFILCTREAPVATRKHPLILNRQPAHPSPEDKSWPTSPGLLPVLPVQKAAS